MNRIGLVAVSAAALMLVASGAAGAKAPTVHHNRHRPRVGHAHHLRTHTVNITPASPASPTSTSSSSDNAGTVASFANGVLTLTLNDGSTVSGMVTSTTEIECHGVSSHDLRTSGDGGGGGSHGRGDQHSDDQHSGDRHGGSSGHGNGGDDNRSGDDNGGDDDNGAGAPTCNMSSLVTGAAVHEAELRVNSSGSTFAKVELARVDPGRFQGALAS
jgi:hypothetical protein